MTTPKDLAQPPRLADWLILFTSGEEEESMAGDLLEEFSQLASKSGVAFARRWYWRQTVKTIVHLTGGTFRAAPWSTTAAVVGGFLLRRQVGGLPEKAIFAVLERYQVFEHHFNAFLFFASTGIDIAQIVSFLLVGCVIALGAKGKEMAATITLGLIFGAMAVAGAVVVVSKTGHYAFLWRLAWYFTDSLAIAIGGAIVRTRRSPARRVSRSA